MTQATDSLLDQQANSMLAMLYRRPQGYVHPQLEGVDYRRCAEVADHLVATGRAETSPAAFGAVFFRPSAAERERKAAAEAKARTDVLGFVMARPDVHVDEFADALPELTEEELRLAFTQLVEWGAIREVDGKLITPELAAERAADDEAVSAFQRADGPLDVAWLKSTGNYNEQSIDRAVAKLTAAGDLERLADGTYEYSSELQRRIRELVSAASTSSVLKRARGMSPADVALELEIGEDIAASTLYGLMVRGWFTREVRGQQYFYLKA